jgi:hypothetical protein
MSKLPRYLCVSINREGWLENVYFIFGLFIYYLVLYTLGKVCFIGPFGKCDTTLGGPIGLVSAPYLPKGGPTKETLPYTYIIFLWMITT